MILQYTGFKNNWCFTEAETISWAIVSIRDIVKDFKDKDNDISTIQHLYEEVEAYIKAETKWDGEITFLSVDDITKLNNITVIMLIRKHDQVAYVTELSRAFILNSEGKTIQRIN